MKNIFQNHQISDPVVVKWIKWFSISSCPKISQLTDLNHIISDIPIRTFSKREIKFPNNGKMTEREYFAELFKLNEIIFPQLTVLTDYLNNSPVVFNEIDVIFPQVAPFIFQYLIRIIYRIENVFIRNEENYSDPMLTIQNVKNLFYLFMKTPEKHFEEAII